MGTSTDCNTTQLATAFVAAGACAVHAIIIASADVQADYQDACKQLEEAQKLLDFVEVWKTVSKLGFGSTITLMTLHSCHHTGYQLPKAGWVSLCNVHFAKAQQTCRCMHHLC